MKKISILQRVNYTKSNMAYVTVKEIVNLIQTGNMVLYDNEFGNYTLRQAIEHIRSLKTHAEQQQWKLRLLPAVAYNGTFSEVNRNGLVQYSDITALDFDKIQDYNEMCHLRNWLIKEPCVCCVFVTPSGRGLKALVLHDNTDPAKHGDLYDLLLRKFNVASKDLSCKDLARRNYLSYDPYIWTNPNPVPYHYVPTVKMAANVQNRIQQNNYQQNNYQQNNNPSGNIISGESIINMMNSSWEKNHPGYWQEGHRAVNIFKSACQLCRFGVDQDLTTDYFVKKLTSKTMTKDEIVGHVRSAYKAEKNNFGKEDFKYYSKKKKAANSSIQSKPKAWYE